MTPSQTEYFQISERLAIAIAAKGIKQSPTVIQNLFNKVYSGRLIAAHSARNWILGKCMPTQENLFALPTY